MLSSIELNVKRSYHLLSLMLNVVKDNLSGTTPITSKEYCGRSPYFDLVFESYNLSGIFITTELHLSSWILSVVAIN